MHMHMKFEFPYTSRSGTTDINITNIKLKNK